MPIPDDTSAAGGRRTAEGGYEFSQVHMGLPVRLVLHGTGRRDAERAARAAFARVASLDRAMSHYREDSELRNLARRSGRFVPVSRALFDVLQRAVEIARVTGGAFDPTVGPFVALWRDARRTGRLPDAAALAAARARTGWQHIALDGDAVSVRLAVPGMQLDLGGIAKGYILQEALAVLRTRGVASALVEAGGDVVAGEAPPGRAGWNISTPGAEAAFAARAARLTHAALATSGATVQFVRIDGVGYSHVIDPRTGLGVTAPRLARVIAADAATADALATALTVLDPPAADAVLRQFPDVSASISAGPGGIR